MAHYIDMLTYAEYAYATTNVQGKSSSQGEKTVVISTTLEEAMGLPEADKPGAIPCLRPRPLDIHSRRAKISRLAVGVQSKGGQDLRGQVCRPRLWTSGRSRL